jgi:hypothetical protein
MANIQIKERMFYQVDPTVAELFVAAGLAEHIVPATPKQKPQDSDPEWCLVTKLIGNAIQPVVCIQHFVNGQRTYYDGPAAGAAFGFQTRRWIAPVDGEAEGHYGFAGPTPPKHILEAYWAQHTADGRAVTAPTLAGDRPPGVSAARTEGQKAEDYKNR